MWKPSGRLDQPPASLDLHAMLRDTLAALEQLPEALVRFRKTLPQRTHSTLPALEISVRKDSGSSQRLTAWFRAEIPKTVKHPRQSGRLPHLF